MAAITQIAYPPPEKHLRPLNSRRDLGQVADLVELCFAENLSVDGQHYLRRMRQIAKNQSGSWFDLAPLPFTSAEGFVWEDNGTIVGNISLIPFIKRGRPLYLIANVAVHPDYRRQGIARALTEAALEQARKRHAHSAWLQVRDDNPSAVELYESTGFTERARRTTWLRKPGNPKSEPATGVRITQRKSAHWKKQHEWLRRNYPDEIAWYWPVSRLAFRPGLLGAVNRFFSEVHLRHWSVVRHGQWMGTLTWRATGAHADQLWLAAPPEHEAAVLQTLLPYIHWRGRSQRPLSLDYPAGRAADALQQAGFRAEHTLIWMEADVS